VTDGKTEKNAIGTQEDSATGTEAPEAPPEAPDNADDARKPTSKNARSLSIRHANGTTERISGDRYEMRDSRQRPIVNREATRTDRKRLETLSR
jgi:hypothetical protein